VHYVILLQHIEQIKYIEIKQKFLEHDEFEAHLQELMSYLVNQSAEQQIEQTLHDLLQMCFKLIVL
jgi:hypothetical protein